MSTIQDLTDAHEDLLKWAKYQQKRFPSDTVRGLEDAIEKSEKIKVPTALTLAATTKANRLMDWETAAHLLAASIQNPSDTETAWRAVLAYVKANGSTKPKPCSPTAK